MFLFNLLRLLTKPTPELPVLGTSLAIREKGTGSRIIFTFLVLIGFPTGMVFSLVLGLSPAWLNFVVVMPFVLAGTAYALAFLFRSVEFYENALVERVFFLRQVIRYDEVRDIEFSLSRQYVNFSYSGTVFRMRLDLTDGRTFQLRDDYGGISDSINMIAREIERKMIARRWPTLTTERREAGELGSDEIDVVVEAKAPVK